METAWVIKRHGEYRIPGNYLSDSITRAEVFIAEEDADYFCQGSTGQPIEIVMMEKDEWDALINMRTECSICGEQLDTRIINNIRRVDPCQRGCRG